MKRSSDSHHYRYSAYKPKNKNSLKDITRELKKLRRKQSKKSKLYIEYKESTND